MTKKNVFATEPEEEDTPSPRPSTTLLKSKETADK